VFYVMTSVSTQVRVVKLDGGVENGVLFDSVTFAAQALVTTTNFFSAGQIVRIRIYNNLLAVMTMLGVYRWENKWLTPGAAFGCVPDTTQPSTPIVSFESVLPFNTATYSYTIQDAGFYTIGVQLTAETRVVLRLGGNSDAINVIADRMAVPMAPAGINNIHRFEIGYYQKGQVVTIATLDGAAVITRVGVYKWATKWISAVDEDENDTDYPLPGQEVYTRRRWQNGRKIFAQSYIGTSPASINTDKAIGAAIPTAEDIIKVVGGMRLADGTLMTINTDNAGSYITHVLLRGATKIPSMQVGNAGLVNRPIGLTIWYTKTTD